MPSPEIDIPSAVQHPLAAGLAGALIGLRWAPGACWAQRLANVLAGSLLAGYLGPWVAQLLGQSSPGAQSAIGFGLGLFGLSWANSIMQLPLADIMRDWLSRSSVRPPKE